MAYKLLCSTEAIDDVRLSGSSQSQPIAFAFSAVSGRINSYETREAPNPKGCDLCKKENHSVRKYARFLQMTVDERSAYIKRKQLCSHEDISCVIAKSLIVALRATAAII